MQDTKREDARGMLIGGLIVLGVGTLFLLHNLGIIPDMDVIWPLFPIIVGIALIVGALLKMRGAGASGP
ncbi:MAG: LiaI-LiaF-like domain-containing protein [Candidatus Polarisedimenticolia bacterium]